MREQIAVLDGLASYDYPTSPVPGDGQNYSGGSNWFPGAPYRLQQEGLAGFRSSSLVAERVSPVPGNGQNYSGGSDWFPGAPYVLQQEGLASYNYPTSPVPGDGQNYSGGSNWCPGAPYRLQQEGLAGLRRRAGGLRGLPCAETYLRAFRAAIRGGQTRASARAYALQVLSASGCR